MWEKRLEVRLDVAEALLVNLVARQSAALEAVGVAEKSSLVPGIFRDRGGTPVADGKVTAASTLFNEGRTTEVDPADGTFVLAGMPVGPLTLTGRDGHGRVVYETIGLETPGADRQRRLPLPPPFISVSRVFATVFPPLHALNQQFIL